MGKDSLNNLKCYLGSSPEDVSVITESNLLDL